MSRHLAAIALIAVTSAAFAASQPAPTTQPAASTTAPLITAIAAPTRTEANRARDRYRHPYETLSFFGVQPNHTIVEIWPGGGWYTEILAPYVKAGGGRLMLATLDGQFGGVAKLKEAQPALFANVTAVPFPAFDVKTSRVPDGSADAVLTFRNVHNWRMGYRREGKPDYSADAFKQMFAMLKPGGMLGIVDHRLAGERQRRARAQQRLHQGIDRAPARRAGRLPLRRRVRSECQPEGQRRLAGGRLDASAVARLGDKDREKYLAIGESDRMTLKFVKP